MQPYLESDSEKVVNIGGEWRRDFKGTFSNEYIDKLKLGYICIQCHLDLSKSHLGAMPVQCPDCGYPMRQRQVRDFEAQYSGVDEEHVNTLRDRGVWLPD